jgi:hypothetical protein
MRTLLILLFGCWSFVAVSNDTGWRLYKQTSTVQVQSRTGDKQLLEIKAQVLTQSKIGAFMHLLEDTAVIADWVDGAQRAQILDHTDPHSHIVHSYFAGFWPVAPRDMITQSIWSQDVATAVLTIDIADRGQDYPAEPGYVRMQQVSGQWRLTPQAEGGLFIQYQGKADPAGKLPNFIGDKAALKATFNTFKNLEKILVGYQREYPGIAEQD